MNRAPLGITKSWKELKILYEKKNSLIFRFQNCNSTQKPLKEAN